MRILFTIISNNYLAHAKAWLNSARLHQPDAVIKVVVADDDKVAKEWLGDDIVVPASDILKDAFADLALRYDVVELNTAIKPFAFHFFFSEWGARQVVFLDPDTILFASLDPILEPLSSGSSAVLTPHCLEARPNDSAGGEIGLLRSGAFNLGFAAFSASEETSLFLEWWGKRLAQFCSADIADGLFTDQKWCDLAPSFLLGLSVCRHRGANVAYWNLAERGLRLNAEGWRAKGGDQLLFFHFSGFDPGNIEQISRHDGSISLASYPEIRSLLVDYGDQLMRCGWEEARLLPNAYAKRNGLLLSRPVRKVFARLFPEPLSPEALEDLDMVHICNEVAPGFRWLPGLRMTRLAAEVLRLHPEVLTRFAINTAIGRWRYLRWLRKHAAKTYDIASEVL